VTEKKIKTYTFGLTDRQFEYIRRKGDEYKSSNAYALRVLLDKIIDGGLDDA